MKKCATCQCLKPTTAFWRRGRKDLLQSSCKDCQRIKEKERRQAYPERYREKHRRFYANHAEAIKAKRKDYHYDNPLAYQARMATKTLERQLCNICGKKADAHHEDYSKPLDVMWLCRQHHIQRHMVKEAAKITIAANREALELLGQH